MVTFWIWVDVESTVLTEELLVGPAIEDDSDAVLSRDDISLLSTSPRILLDLRSSKDLNWISEENFRTRSISSSLRPLEEEVLAASRAGVSWTLMVPLSCLVFSGEECSGVFEDVNENRLTMSGLGDKTGGLLVTAEDTGEGLEAGVPVSEPEKRRM